MSKSIKQRVGGLSCRPDAEQLRVLLNAVLADNTALRSTVAALVADITELDSTIDTLVAKMNADAGITDTDYAGAAAMTASAPSELTLTS